MYFIRERNIQEKEIIQKIKFKNEPYLSGYFRIGIRGIFSDIIKNYSSFRITVAPSHKKTVSGRPYHSCSSILDYARRSVTTTVEQPIEKISGELQSGKTFRERFLHARHAFRIKSEFVNRLSGNWLLVDDVFTTGASINEISRLLKENGAENVIALVMAKNL
ncbi:MAG: hypothetical protein K8R21_16570 [Leptospira sp.]|nr:hypothetical protein [Leptospira sp.]